MNVTLLVVGKTVEQYLQNGIDQYTKRLKFYVKFELIVIPELKNAKNLSLEQIKETEGDAILEKLNSNDVVILLDENGKQYSSVEFAKQIETFGIRGTKNLVFVVGGAYGFAKKIYDKATDKMSLSKMTFSHQMVRLIFVEQLYRAHTIIKGEPYHHQ